MTIPSTPSTVPHPQVGPHPIVVLRHPGGSSIVEEAADRAARVEIAENAIPTRLGRRTERAAHNGPQASGMCVNGKDT